MTFDAYRALSGLEGAIARRADELTEALPAEIQDALPAVLRALTTLRLGDQSVTALASSRAELTSSRTRAALVDALIEARLLVIGRAHVKSSLQTVSSWKSAPVSAPMLSVGAPRIAATTFCFRRADDLPRQRIC